MADEIMITREEKLAAARRKLKEYQRLKADAGHTDESVSRTVSDKSELDCNVSELGDVEGNKHQIHEQKQISHRDVTHINNKSPTNVHDLHALEILVAEKTQLTQDLNKLSAQLREKYLEANEIRTQLHSYTQRNNELQGQFLLQQQSTEQLRKHNAELQHKLAQARAENEDQTTFIQELQKENSKHENTIVEDTQEFKILRDKLEMAEIRIQQLSEDSNSGIDNRVESMMQTQLMHEQQIRDLQAMVQQLSEEKEQANIQYQSYVQQLNVEVAKMNERNVKLQQDNERLQQREQQLVAHVSSLERDIQKSFNRQQKFQSDLKNTERNVGENEELQNLRKKTSELEFERNEFILKIKSQENRLQLLSEKLQTSHNEVETLQNSLEMISSTQPEHTKLLAIMESDKVAASRAMSQNMEMKKQLDELEIRFVQLTNDKADLRNSLDAEEFANKEIRQKYENMEDRMRSMYERFKYKDEEMIRLAHENIQLTSELDSLQHKLKKQQSKKNREICKNNIESQNHEYSSSEQNEHLHEHQEHDHLDHDHPDHNHDSDNHEHDENIESEVEDCIDALDSNGIETTSIINEIYTSEAMEKLQQRFTKIIRQVADLTDEKQRLEHLVLQLQGETETIGEYVTLYQTQRRMLKQREYEKAAQMVLLQTEREQLREKIQMLNNLVSRLGIQVPVNFGTNNATQDQEETQHIREATPTNKSNDSRIILNKIHNIITEIEENTKGPVIPEDIEPHNADHLKCCSGKFEVV